MVDEEFCRVIRLKWIDISWLVFIFEVIELVNGVKKSTKIKWAYSSTQYFGNIALFDAYIVKKLSGLKG